MASFPPEEVRDDFVPKGDFLDRSFHELEKEHLWPKVWQIACREAEIPDRPAKPLRDEGRDQRRLRAHGAATRSRGVPASAGEFLIFS